MDATGQMSEGLAQQISPGAQLRLICRNRTFRKLQRNAERASAGTVCESTLTVGSAAGDPRKLFFGQTSWLLKRITCNYAVRYSRDIIRREDFSAAFGCAGFISCLHVLLTDATALSKSFALTVVLSPCHDIDPVVWG